MQLHMTSAAMVISIIILLSSITQGSAQPATDINMTAVMSAHGCKLFATTLLAGDGWNQHVFEASVGSGLTIFCPPDAAMKAVFRMPEYKKLSSDDKGKFLQYHALIFGYKNMQYLKSANGDQQTLATTNEERYMVNVKHQGKEVMLNGKARVVNTIVDKRPLVIIRINTALMPTELFKTKGGPM